MASSSSVKRQQRTLSLNDKWDIIQRLDRGERMSSLSKEYDIAISTIHYIKKNRENITNFIKKSSSVHSLRKTLKKGFYPEVEDALYTWFVQERKRYVPITGDILKEKAKFLYKVIMKKEGFHASDGWLERFKKRFGIYFSKTTFVSCEETFTENLETKFVSELIESEVPPVDSSERDVPEHMYTVTCDEAANSVNIVLQWAVERGVDQAKICLLKELQEDILAESLYNKDTNRKHF